MEEVLDHLKESGILGLGDVLQPLGDGQSASNRRGGVQLENNKIINNIQYLLVSLTMVKRLKIRYWKILLPYSYSKYGETNVILQYTNIILKEGILRFDLKLPGVVSK